MASAELGGTRLWPRRKAQLRALVAGRGAPGAPSRGRSEAGAGRREHCPGTWGRWGGTAQADHGTVQTARLQAPQDAQGPLGNEARDPVRGEGPQPSPSPPGQPPVWVQAGQPPGGLQPGRAERVPSPVSSGAPGSEGAGGTSYPLWGGGPRTGSAVTLTAQMEKPRQPERHRLSTQVAQRLGRPQLSPTPRGHQRPGHSVTPSPHPRNSTQGQTQPHTPGKGVQRGPGCCHSALCHVRLCNPTDGSTPGLPVHAISWSLLKLMSIESVMPSNHLILCRPLLLPPSVFPSTGSFPVSQVFASGGQSIGPGYREGNRGHELSANPPGVPQQGAIRLLAEAGTKSQRGVKPRPGFQGQRTGWLWGGGKISLHPHLRPGRDP